MVEGQLGGGGRTTSASVDGSLFVLVHGAPRRLPGGEGSPGAGSGRRLKGRVAQGGQPGEFVVHSTFVNYRSRVEKDNDLLVGRREDVLRADGDSFKLARRKIIITQSVLMAKNLNTFL